MGADESKKKLRSEWVKSSRLDRVNLVQGEVVFIRLSVTNRKATPSFHFLGVNSLKADRGQNTIVVMIAELQRALLLIHIKCGEAIAEHNGVCTDIISIKKSADGRGRSVNHAVSPC